MDRFYLRASFSRNIEAKQLRMDVGRVMPCKEPDVRKQQLSKEKGGPAFGFHLAFALPCGIFCAIAALFACSPDPSDILLPAGDIRPPSIIDAGQNSPEAFKILFDENIEPVEKSFVFEPATAAATPRSEGRVLTISFQPPLRRGSNVRFRAKPAMNSEIRRDSSSHLSATTITPPNSVSTRSKGEKQFGEQSP